MNRAPTPGVARPAGRLARLLLITACSTAAVAAQTGRDEPLAQILRGLSGPHLQFVFSSRLLPDSLRGTAPDLPAGATTSEALAAATALLGPRGLGVRRVGTGLYAVVALPVGEPAKPPARVDGEPLSELVVAASRYRVTDASVGVTELDANELALGIVPGSDPMRALARVPGIVQDGLSARSHVRGGEQDEELMLLDGFPLRSAYHMAAYQSPLSVVDASVIRSIDVYTGGFPARYGNRMAAVFDVQTFDAHELPPRSLAADFVNASARVAGEPIAGIDGVADLRIGTLSPLLEEFAPRVGRPRYGDLFLAANHAFSGGARVDARLLVARDDLAISDERRQEAASLDERLRYLWVHGTTPLWEGATGDAWLGQTRLDSRRVGSLATPGIATGSVDDHRASTLWDLRTRVAFDAGARHYLEAGTEFTHERGAYQYASAVRFAPDVASLFQRAPVSMRQFDLDPERRRAGLFVTHRWQMFSTVTTEVGARAEGVVTLGEDTRWNLDPRLGVRWDARPGTRLHVNWGVYRQADEIHELKLEDGRSAFPKAQVSRHFIVGLDQALAVDTRLRVEAFSKRQSDPRARFENVFNRRTILPEIGPDRIEILPDSAEVHGIEISGERRRGAWQTSFNAGWSEALDETADAGGQPHTRRSWDVGFDLGAATTWRAGPWTLTSGIARHPGFPTTRLTPGTNGTPVIGARNAARLPAYLQVDLRAEFVQAAGDGVLQYSAQITNVLNERNDCCTELLRADGGSLYLRRLRGLPLLPSLGVRWSW